MTTTHTIDQKTRSPATLWTVVLRQLNDGVERQDRIRYDVFHEARRVLDALPLASDDYCRAVNGLRNVQHYVVAGEHGAARYELMLLERVLNAVLNPPNRRSQRQRRGLSET